MERKLTVSYRVAYRSFQLRSCVYCGLVESGRPLTRRITHLSSRTSRRCPDFFPRSVVPPMLDPQSTAGETRGLLRLTNEWEDMVRRDGPDCSTQPTSLTTQPNPIHGWTRPMSTFDGTYPGGNKLFVVRFAILSLDSVACTVRQKTDFLKNIIALLMSFVG